MLEDSYFGVSPYGPQVLRCGMEGISDGRALDRCFYCALLFPDVESCPRCGNRLRYQPARMAPSQSLQAEWDRIVKQFIRKHSQAKALPKGLPIMAEPANDLPLNNLGKKKPSRAEIKTNKRSRSAILRLAEKC